MNTENTNLQISASITGSALTIVVSLLIRNKIQKEQLARKSAERARLEALRSSSQIRADLSRVLHDTTAKDLARISVAAQQLSSHCPSELQKDVEFISFLAAEASRGLRPLILDLELQKQFSSLEEALEIARAMLSTRSITVEIESNTSIHNLNSTLNRIASLVVREGAANILKYGKYSSTASLELSVNESKFEITMVNEIDKDTPLAGHSSGFGLSSLQRAMTEAGGELNFASTGSRWILNATIPLRGEIDD